MKYYSLEHEYRQEIVGGRSYPQSEGMTDDYNYLREDSVRNLWYDNTKIEPNLDAIKLTKGVKLTDMLSVVVIHPAAGTIVSDSFKSLLLEFSLPKHIFFQAKVVDYKQRVVQDKQYYLLRLIEHQNQFINFDRSEFYIHSLGEGEVGNIDINCKEDLELSSEELGLGVGEVIRPRFISFFAEGSFDFFSFRRFSPNFIVSERLKMAIESTGLTGVCFEPADFILQQG